MSQPVQSFANKLHEAFSEKFNFKTILALVIFGMIILTFIFSGMLGAKGSGHLGMGVAATVNGEIISIKQFQDQENRVSSYYSQMLGGQFENLIQKKMLQTEALNQLVDNSVAAQSAQNEMIFATDANIKNAIQDMPYFKKDNVFQSDLYKGILANNGLTPGEFEKSMRQQISIQKVRDLFEASTVVTSLEKNIEADLKQSKINLYYLKISPEMFTNSQIPEALVNSELNKPEFKNKVADYIKTHDKETNITAGRKILANEKSFALAKQIEETLSKSTEKSAVEAELSKLNLKLKETGPFEISVETVPGLNSQAVFKAALNLTKEKPVLPNLVKDGDNQYLVILKDMTKDVVLVDLKTEKKHNEMLDKQKAYSQYQFWIEDNKKVFSINKNSDLIQN